MDKGLPGKVTLDGVEIEFSQDGVTFSIDYGPGPEGGTERITIWRNQIADLHRLLGLYLKQR
jgi:hypothetical protein